VPQIREDLALRAEAPFEFAIGESTAHEFDRDARLVALIGALRKPHNSHSAAHDLLEQSIGSDDEPAACRLANVEDGAVNDVRQRIALDLGGLRREQAIDAASERRVYTTGRIEECRSVSCGTFQRSVKQRLDASEFLVHRQSLLLL
jgi:hypothetical protein